MYCENCGAELSDEALFCGECGHKVREKLDNNSQVEKKLISNASSEIKKSNGTGDIKGNFKGINKKYLIFGLAVVIIILLASILFSVMTAVPEVTYENYPDISKEVIDSFNKWDKNNDSFIGANEYNAYGYSAVWSAMDDKGYVNHTVRYKGNDIPAMDITDYNRAYDFEQKEIQKEYDKRIAQQNELNEKSEQAYQKWYSRHGNPNLSEKENRQLFERDFTAWAYNYFGLS